MNLKPLITVVTAALVIAGVALGASVVGFFSPARDDALGLVPADAAVYGNVFLDPSGPQKLALQDLLERFPAEGRPEGVVDLLDEVLKEVGLAFESDIEPWLGDQIAFFVQAPANFIESPPLAVLVAATDPARALEAVDKAQDAEGVQQDFQPAAYEGVDYELGPDDVAVGAVGDFLVSGSDAGFKAVVDTLGSESLEDSDRYQDTVAGLSEDRLALFYVDPKRFANFAQGAAGIGIGTGAFPFPGIPQEPAAAVVYARDDGIMFESVATLPGEGPISELSRAGARESKPLALLPRDTLVTFGIPELGKTLQYLQLAEAFGTGAGVVSPFGPDPLAALSAQLGIDIERDVLSWMGDGAVFFAGSGPGDEGGGLIVQTPDPAKADAALGEIEAALRRAGAPIRRLDFGVTLPGFALQDEGMPKPVNVFRTKDLVGVVYGDSHSANVVRGVPKLGEMPAFLEARTALGDGFGVGGFVDVEGILTLVSGLVGGQSQTYVEDVEPWLLPIDFVVFGSKLDGDRVIGRVLVRIR